jgi:Protein of unknown function (DUF421)
MPREGFSRKRGESVVPLMLQLLFNNSIIEHNQFDCASNQAACLRHNHLLAAAVGKMLSVGVYSHWFGDLIKGPEQVLMHDGKLVDKTMRHNHITQHDLQEDLRLALQTERFDSIRGAILERSGGISFVKTNG